MFYARAMASWALLNSLSGFEYDGVRHVIRIQRRLHGNPFRSFWISGTGWGTFGTSEKTLIFKIDFGKQLISEFRLEGFVPKVVSLNNRPAPAEIQSGSVRFIDTIQINEGDTLKVEF
jgi:hypothetical protein